MKPQKRRRRRRPDRLVLNLLVLVTLVLVVFEGKLIYTMFTHRSSTSEAHTTSSGTTAAASGSVSGSKKKKTDSKKTSEPLLETSDTLLGETSLAGLPAKLTASSSAPVQDTEPLPTVSDPDSPAIVPKSEVSVDDSYFSDAVFIGDSRMEGFRNASGITQGQFFTSVGMSLSSMRSDPIISTPEGNITVAAALSGGSYSKIYLMLGTNDLGEYDWDSFREGFIATMERFQEIQPGAIIYVCSVIYVDESKAASTQYVNNANVDKINSILLDICEEKGYYYLDLNKFLSSGYGTLIDGASSDGVHLYPEYCKQMLDYLKSHYIEVPESNGSEAESDEITASETEAASEADPSDDEGAEA